MSIYNLLTSNFYTLHTNNLNITNTTQSISYSTGSCVINGGCGISGDLFVNGLIHGDTITQTDLKLTSSTQSTSTNSGALQVVGGGGIGKDLYVGGDIFCDGSFNSTSLKLSTLTTSSTLQSSSTSTGSVIINGGAGIGKNLYIGGDLHATNLFGSISITSTPSLSITNTTQSTDTNSGSLIVAGGASLAGDLFIGGTLHVSGSSPISYVTENFSFAFTGAFDGTMTGFFIKINNIVTLSFNSVIGASLHSNTLYTSVSVPAAYKPSNDIWGTIVIYDDSKQTLGACAIYGTGIIEIKSGRNNAILGHFSDTGECGILYSSFSYYV